MRRFFPRECLALLLLALPACGGRQPAERSANTQGAAVGVEAPTLSGVASAGRTPTSEESASGGPPDGHYRCYTYHPGAVFVGALIIDGDKYRTDRGGSSGRYRSGMNGRVDFDGDAPLGFRVGMLEEREPRPKLRLYAQAADIGSSWKAAVCTGGEDPGSDAEASSSAGKGGAYARGAKVEATYIGYWYPATVIRCEGARCLLHYDDPASKDEWVDVSRLRPRS